LEVGARDAPQVAGQLLDRPLDTARDDGQTRLAARSDHDRRPREFTRQGRQAAERGDGAEEFAPVGLVAFGWGSLLKCWHVPCPRSRRRFDERSLARRSNCDQRPVAAKAPVTYAGSSFRPVSSGSVAMSASLLCRLALPSGAAFLTVIGGTAGP